MICCATGIKANICSKIGLHCIGVTNLVDHFSLDVHTGEKQMQEEFIDGLELTVPILGDQALTPIEIAPKEPQSETASPEEKQIVILRSL